MKVLFTTPVLENPAASGSALRITNSIKALNMIAEVHVISRVPRALIGGVHAEKYFRKICYKFKYSPSATSRDLEKIANYRVGIKNVIINQIINFPFRVFGRIYNYAVTSPHNYFILDVQFIRNYVIKHHINIIWFGYGNVSFDLMKALKEFLPEVKMICDTDSVWSRFVLRELDVEIDPARRKEIEAKGLAKEAEEKSWVEFMDVTTAVSEVDAEYYRSIASDINKIKVFSNVIDKKMYEKTPSAPNDFKKPCIYLAGTFWKNSPMENAARWVLNEVLPVLQKKIPDISFYIVGNGSDSVLADIDSDNITITGKLESVLPYLCNADVALVPLKFESGTRFKILEAGVCGVPIVSTTLGAEGIPVTHNKDILIADTPIEFADAIIRLIKDRKFAEEIAGNCKKLIEDKYSVEYLAGEGKAILEHIKATNTK
jgi:glycosyltransferase involved in cell wall biosynthesis